MKPLLAKIGMEALAVVGAKALIAAATRAPTLPSGAGPYPLNGLSRGKTTADFDPVELRKGTLVEFEHTRDRSQAAYHVAERIAMDHLTEDPNYYKKLAVMESTPIVGADVARWTFWYTKRPGEAGWTTTNPEVLTSYQAWRLQHNTRMRYPGVTMYRFIYDPRVAPTWIYDLRTEPELMAGAPVKSPTAYA